MSVVSIKLDESTVTVCLTHRSCPKSSKGSADQDCERRWIFGVGAAVYEDLQDLEDMRRRLDLVRTSILLRADIESTRRMKSFIKRGWHATDDGPEFADPLLMEIDRGATFKGHVRYCISEKLLDHQEQEKVFDHLFGETLKMLASRYKNSGSIDVVFEDDGSPKIRYEQIVRAAGVSSGRMTLASEPKRDDALAMADYLLYSTLQFVARGMQLCNEDANCRLSHAVPTASDVVYANDGRIEVTGHVGAAEFAYRRYANFVRDMSSVVNLRGAIGIALSGG